MNICTQTVLPYVFLLLEARFGCSRLQNYQAITTGSFIASHTSILWRLVILLFIALPLGLSVAYKRFYGGLSSASVSLDFVGEYGIGFPKIGSWSPADDAIYLLITSMSAFQSASQLGKAQYPSEEQFPLAYGYNTLLLSNKSAAVLDVPSQSYIRNMTGRMSASETWILDASVDAYIASCNSTALEQDDAAWASAVKLNYALSAMFLWKTPKECLGMMTFNPNNQIYFGLYQNSSYNAVLQTYNPTKDLGEAQNFRKSANLYDVKRGRCQGSWQINTTSILLVGGYCDMHVVVNSSILQSGDMTPYAYDALPPLAHTFEYFAVPPTSAWLGATYAVSVATVYWARALYMLGRASAYAVNYTGPYPPRNETIVSTRGTLNPDWLLYLILAVQPTITILGFVASIWLHNIPIDKGFGIISILSGFKASSGSIIKGAALSGKLRQPVRLEIVPAQIGVFEENSYVETTHRQTTPIQYILTRASRLRGTARLRPGQEYS